MIKLNFFGKTDVGKVRTENQDYFDVIEEKNCFIVCDGMGGGMCGDFASKATTEIIRKILEFKVDFKAIEIQYLSQKDKKNIVLPSIIQNGVQKQIIFGISLANDVLFKLQEKYLSISPMGTTVVALLFDDKYNISHIFNIGDSRIYRYRDGNLEQLTKDHSKIEELLSSGKITQDELKRTELKSMVVRILGPKSNVLIDYKMETVLPKDIYILCSDGITDLINESKMKQIIEKNISSSKDISEELVEEANNLGGKDNSTVVAVEVPDSYKNEQLPEEFKEFISKTFECNINKKTTKDFAFYSLQMTKKFEKKLPKDIKEKTIFRNPVFLSLIFLFLIISITSFFVYYKNKFWDIKKQQIQKLLTSGIILEVKIPDEKSIKEYNSEVDTTKKLLIADFWKNNFDNLKNINNLKFEIYNEIGEKVYDGYYNSKPIAIKLSEGKYRIVFGDEIYNLIPLDNTVTSDTFEVVKSKEFQKQRFVIIPK